MWYHVRNINPVKIRPERITQNNKGFANYLDGVEFPVREKDFSKIETKKNYENGMGFLNRHFRSRI